jgi:alkylated DNA repair dioxygenase AlkB
MSAQPCLFDLPPLRAKSRKPVILPPGLRYHSDLITPDEEQALARQIQALPFKPFEFQGYVGNRRVVSFGWRYDFARQVLEPAAPIPAFLLPLRARVAGFTGHGPHAFQQVLVLEYTPGAGIGWHRDRPQFEDIAGVSLLSACPLRFRRKSEGGWERSTLSTAPRSAYVIGGEARTDWEHSIPPVESLRYSVTFRTFR